MKVFSCLTKKGVSLSFNPLCSLNTLLCLGKKPFARKVAIPKIIKTNSTESIDMSTIKHAEEKPSTHFNTNDSLGKRSPKISIETGDFDQSFKQNRIPNYKSNTSNQEHEFNTKPRKQRFEKEEAGDSFERTRNNPKRRNFLDEDNDFDGLDKPNSSYRGKFQNRDYSRDRNSKPHTDNYPTFNSKDGESNRRNQESGQSDYYKRKGNYNRENNEEGFERRDRRERFDKFDRSDRSEGRFERRERNFERSGERFERNGERHGEKFVRNSERFGERNYERNGERNERPEKKERWERSERRERRREQFGSFDKNTEQEGESNNRFQHKKSFDKPRYRDRNQEELPLDASYNKNAEASNIQVKRTKVSKEKLSDFKENNIRKKESFTKNSNKDSDLDDLDLDYSYNNVEKVEEIPKTTPVSSFEKKVDEATKITINNQADSQTQQPSQTPPKIPPKDSNIKFEYLYGIHSVEASLSFTFRKASELFIQQTYKNNTPENVKKIKELAEAKNLTINYVTRERLDKLSGNRPNNGVILKSQKRDYLFVRSFDFFHKEHLKSPTGNLLVFLDQIVDPQNLGSIIRSSFFLGVDQILLNKKNKPPISSAVSKVSSGASECMELFAVRSVKPFLINAREHGWKIVSTIIEKEDQTSPQVIAKEKAKEEEKSSSDVEDEKDQKSSEDFVVENSKVTKTISMNELKLSENDNVILVLGGEGSGVSNVLSNVADYNVFIPPRLDTNFIGKHPYTLVDSLNVGVSAGILISYIKSNIQSQNSGVATETANNNKESNSSQNESTEENSQHKEETLLSPTNGTERANAV